MSQKVITLEQAKIKPCKSVIIKDPYYDRHVWCAFQEDNCSQFTHTKAVVSNYDEHYKDGNFEMDINNTDFLLVLGTEEFVSKTDILVTDAGKLSARSMLRASIQEAGTTEIGCDTAQFSFGTERTFHQFSIKTGSDGAIGEVHLYRDKTTKDPVGLMFLGGLDGEIVPPELMMDSIKAAFEVEKEKKRSLQSKIDNAEKQKNSGTTLEKEEEPSKDT